MNNRIKFSAVLASFIMIIMLVSIAGAAPFAYITNSGNNTVSVIDTATNNVTAVVPVGGGPEGVAVTPDGSKVYVANLYDNTVSVIDTATNNVIATVPVGNQTSDPTYSGNPFGIAVTPDGSKVYVANENGNFHTVSVIYTANNTVIATVPIGNQASSIIGNPFGVAIATDGNKVYVSDDDKTVYVIDTATNTITTTVPVVSYPQGIAVSPDGKNVYITSIASNIVSVIDIGTNTVTANISVGNCPQGIAVTPDGSKVYVANYLSNNLSVIDAAINKIIDTVNLGQGPIGVAVTPDGSKVYVANYLSNNLSVIDAATNTITATIDGFSRPIAFGIFIGPLPAKPLLPIADFSANLTSGNAPLFVQFTSISRNADSLKWDFGDGANSTENNQEHTYSTAGNYTVNLTASNANGTDSKTATINVNKATPTITWNNPADITYGTAISGTQLNAVASVPGTYVYTPVAGTILNAGTQTLHVDFTPTDTVNYNTTSKDVTINVINVIQKTTPTITWNNPADITYGTALSATQLNAVCSVPGTYVYTPVAGTVLNAGTQTLHVDFTPTDTANYNTASKDVTINVANIPKTTPTITWNNPADIAYGKPLSSKQLNAKASVRGTFVYTPSAGTVLAIGSQVLKVEFTPKDATKYTTATQTVTINVVTVPLASFSAFPTSGKAPLPVTFTDTSTGSPSTWTWKFGDGGSLTSKIPYIAAHTYTKKGKYTVTLTVKNAAGSNTAKKTSYIIVK